MHAWPNDRQNMQEMCVMAWYVYYIYYITGSLSFSACRLCTTSILWQATHLNIHAAFFSSSVWQLVSTIWNVFEWGFLRM